MKKVIITTGGTGGHIYPALAVAEELKKNDVDVLFVGSKSRMESKMVPENDLRFIGLDINPPKNFSTAIKFLKSIKEAFNIVKREKPDAVIGFGNYISVPIILASVLLRKKVYLQEQNVNLGLANKLFYNFAKKTFLAFEKTYDDMPMKNQKKFKVTGNPLRKDVYNINYFEEKRNMKIENGEKVILITGGSLGAQEINDEVIKQWDKFYENKKIRVYWATGKENYENIISKIDKKKENDVIQPYFDNILNIMCIADLVICRAGALTISEIIELEKPAIIIPYSSVKVGQQENAKILSEREAALVYNSGSVKQAIEEALVLIRNDEILRSMKIKVRSLKKNNASKEIVSNIDIWGN